MKDDAAGAAQGARGRTRAPAAEAMVEAKDGVAVMEKTAADTPRHLVAGRGGAQGASKLGCALKFQRHQWRNSCHERSRQPGSHKKNQFQKDGASCKISPRSPNDGWLVAAPLGWQPAQQSLGNAGQQCRCARRLAAPRDTRTRQTKQ